MWHVYCYWMGNKKEHKMKDEEIMSAEEFFGDLTEDKPPRLTCKRRGRKAKKDTLAEVKIKMVMRIYGVSRARAAEIIAGRAAEKVAFEAAKDEARERASSDDHLMSAEEFFGMSK